MKSKGTSKSVQIKGEKLMKVEGKSNGKLMKT